ncbi:hypothetical protein B0H11DRAFT_418311 [Mycena galericulata]|nr:hypothetical protein B0H11DRAFT_418311 [Mycena galericulata]
MSEPKRRKPPACDACKSKRVLCHPQPIGTPCPRCAEKGLVCKTTPVPRGRPRKHPLPVQGVSLEVLELQRPSTSSSQSVVSLRPELSASPELPSDLVQNLIESLNHFPLSRFPLLHGGALKKSLASAAWQMDLLMPQQRVLACCACALSALISFHGSIIGPGLRPESFQDRSVFFTGSDLRAFGIRRAPMCRSLYEHAFALACEARIHLEPSEVNAASCFILGLLERFNETTSRPWAVAYISHIRTLAGSWNDVEQQRGVWAGFLMAEALASTARRMPVLITHNDQLLITGSEPPSLEQLLTSLQVMHQTSKKPFGGLAFTAVRPVLFHVTGLARDLHDKITGDYARRHPIAEVAVVRFLASLSILQSIVTMVFSEILGIDGGVSPFRAFPTLEPPVRHGEHDTLRACGYAIAIGYMSLVLALHREMERRATAGAGAVQDPWAQERSGVLRRQAYELASATVADVARTLRLLPSLPHLAHIAWSNLQGWAEFVLAEADTAGTIPPARVQVFEVLVAALKLTGYSWDIPHLSVLIDRMEGYVAQHRNPSFADNSAIAHVFPLDDSWMGLLPIDMEHGNGSMAFFGGPVPLTES